MRCPVSTFVKFRLFVLKLRENDQIKNEKCLVSQINSQIDKLTMVQSGSVSLLDEG
jgi:hypothetical protein